MLWILPMNYKNLLTHFLIALLLIYSLWLLVLSLFLHIKSLGSDEELSLNNGMRLGQPLFIIDHAYPDTLFDDTWAVHDDKLYIIGGLLNK